MVAKLKEYNEKRNFEKTLEPEGEVAGSEESLRFVVQHHLARQNHYDLRLEWGGVLLSWAVPKGPSYHTKDKRLAVKVEDHPLEYRNFEGTIPKGEYGGGTVMLWDEGFWEPYGDVEEGIAKGELKFALKGRRLKGKWALIRWKAKSGESRDNWLLLKEKDAYVQETDGISAFTSSIRTGRTMEEIEKGEEEKTVINPFQSTPAQLAKLASKIPKDGNWLYELKYDGYRIIAYVEGNTARLVTRNGNDYTQRFRDVASSLMDLASGRAIVLDGEIAVLDEAGKTDFHALQNYMKNPKPQNLTYIIFDLLALDGVDLRGQPLIHRKSKLEELMKESAKNLFFSRHISGNGEESFAAACEAEMEGIIGKKADSIYSGTRNGDWIKMKCDRRQEFVIGGYTSSEKRMGGISSLLLGAYENGEFIYTGRAGTGISEGDRKALAEAFAGIQRATPPFKEEPRANATEKISWLEPRLVAEIKFAEWTGSGLLRQASYKGLRAGKEPGDITIENAGHRAGREVTINEAADGAEHGFPNRARIAITTAAAEGIASTAAVKTAAEAKAGTTTGIPVTDRASNKLIIEGVKISNPDKVLFDDPLITKGDVARYYAAVSQRMLPYVGGRILSTIRCPKGISQTCFFKKHPGPSHKGIETIQIPNSEGEAEEYFYVKDTQGLVYEAQMGTLEFHTWGSKVDSLDRPDMMIFDLDPDEGMDLATVRQGVKDLKNILSELSLNAYLKTSGGKGYHIVVPLKPAATWDVFSGFARQVAEVMENKWPDRYTSNIRKTKRKNKIFIDWIRNGRGATSVAPYSIRARKGAGVSMPIAWDELDSIAPDGIDMAGALRRVADEDPWEGFFANDQMLTGTSL